MDWKNVERTVIAELTVSDDDVGLVCEALKQYIQNVKMCDDVMRNAVKSLDEWKRLAKEMNERDQ